MKGISIKKEGIRIIIDLFGIKFKIKYTKKVNYPVDNILIKQLTEKMRENTVLMLEANDFHGEIMPSYIKYLLDLGYNVDLLTTEKHKEDSTLCRLKTDKLNEYYTNISTIEKILQNVEIMDKYKGLFVNSMCLFRKDRAIKSPALIYKYFNKVHTPKNGFVINVCHSIENFKTKFLKQNNCVILARAKKDLPIVNPCYFGDVTITNKNEKTTFLISGDGSKNFGIVSDAVKELLKNGITNFKVYITGRCSHKELTEDIKSHIEFLGYVSFEELYNLVEQSDFIIPCLDPDNKKHLWYLDNGTSGAFQLSYGFLKPMIIAEKFANKALVDRNSSVVYSSNDDLYHSMLYAIEMPQSKYLELQNILKSIVQNLYNTSLDNLRALIHKYIIKGVNYE